MLNNRIVLNTLLFQQSHDIGESQLQIVENLLKYGIGNIEIRREYASQSFQEMKALNKMRLGKRLTLFYSVPDNLFVNGAINPELIQYIGEAQKMGVSYVKLTLGDFDNYSGNLFEDLSSIVPESIQINIENDQTISNSSIHSLVSFFNSSEKSGAHIGFVNDLGNWAFTGQDEQEASIQLLKYTNYVHLKSYQYETKSHHPQTVPFAKGELDWKKLLRLFSTDVPVALEYPTDGTSLKTDLSLLSDQLYGGETDV